jgi:hypothetical protein
MVEVDPTSAVVGAAGEVPLIDTFQEPVAAVCVGVRRRVALRTPPVRRWLRGSGTRWMRAVPTFTSHATKRAPPRPALMILDWRSPSEAQLSAWAREQPPAW